MRHHWHIHPDHQRPTRVCCECNLHQYGIWYDDHITNLWLIQWDDDKSMCEVGWQLGHTPAEVKRQANWKLN